jgi:hypothetical protein
MEDNLKSPKYEQLRKDFISRNTIFEKKEKILRNEIFQNVNKTLELYEKKIKENFLKIWKNSGNNEYEFINIKITLNPFTWHNHASVMTLQTPKEIIDLESIALSIPLKLKEKIGLINIPQYESAKEKMRLELKFLGLYNQFSNIEEIGNFQERFNILSFRPNYFENKVIK